MASREELEAMGISNQKNISNDNKVSLIKCEVCGKEIAQNAVSCPNCGAKNKNNNETDSTGVKVICFLIPLVGIICKRLSNRKFITDYYSINYNYYVFRIYDINDYKKEPNFL